MPAYSSELAVRALSVYSLNSPLSALQSCESYASVQLGAVRALTAYSLNSPPTDITELPELTLLIYGAARALTAYNSNSPPSDLQSCQGTARTHVPPIYGAARALPAYSVNSPPSAQFSFTTSRALLTCQSSVTSSATTRRRSDEAFWSCWAPSLSGARQPANTW